MTPALTEEELKAIKALQRLAKRWPRSLWLFAASGTLNVMRNGPDGKPVFETDLGSVDHAYKVTSIRGIPSDGGDW